MSCSIAKPEPEETIFFQLILLSLYLWRQLPEHLLLLFSDCQAVQTPPQAEHIKA